MSDKEIPSDQEPSGDGKDGSSGMVSMDQLEKAVDSAVERTIEAFKPVLSKAQDEQTERLKQSQRDAIKDRVGSTVEKALQEAGVSTSSVPSEDDGKSTQAPSEAEGKTAPAPTGTDVVAGEMTKILEDAGLTGNEPEIKEWMEANKGKPWYESGASFFAAAQTIKGRADASPLGAGEGKPVVPDSLVDKYVADRREIYARMSKGEITHIQAKAEADAVKAAAKEAGVPVDQIGFGSAGSIARQNEYKSLS